MGRYLNTWIALGTMMTNSAPGEPSMSLTQFEPLVHTAQLPLPIGNEDSTPRTNE